MLQRFDTPDQQIIRNDKSGEFVRYTDYVARWGGPIDFQWRTVDGWKSANVCGSNEDRQRYAKQMASKIGLGYRELYSSASPSGGELVGWQIRRRRTDIPAAEWGDWEFRATEPKEWSNYAEFEVRPLYTHLSPAVRIGKAGSDSTDAPQSAGPASSDGSACQREYRATNDERVAALVAEKVRLEAALERILLELEAGASAMAYEVGVNALDGASMHALSGTVEKTAWCQPMHNGEHTSRKFIVRFEDAERGDAVFDDEVEAREFWVRANQSWNCYLFGALPFRSVRGDGAFIRSRIAVVQEGAEQSDRSHDEAFGRTEAAEARVDDMVTDKARLERALVPAQIDAAADDMIRELQQSAEAVVAAKVRLEAELAKRARERAEAIQAAARSATLNFTLGSALRDAKASLTKIRACSVVGAQEGYAKPELWANDLYASHGDVARSLKQIDAALSHNAKSADVALATVAQMMVPDGLMLMSADEAKRHAIELEQCSIFTADVGSSIAKAMTDAAAWLRYHVTQNATVALGEEGRQTDDRFRQLPQSEEAVADKARLEAESAERRRKRNRRRRARRLQ